MKVLYLVATLPTESNPRAGVFVKEQIDSLKLKGVEADTLEVNDRKEDKYGAFLKAVVKLNKKIRQVKYDFIHAHYGSLGLIACCQTKLPVAITFWGDDVLGTPAKTGRYKVKTNLLVALNKKAADKAFLVIVQSEEMKKRLGKQNAFIVPFGVDFKLFRPVDRKEACLSLKLDPGIKRILFANDSNIPVKQFSLARKVFNIVKEKHHNTELVVTNKYPREAMPLYMNACDALILTSLHEGSPNVIKEAMACNLPIVSVDVGDVREVVKDTKNCFIASRDPAEMAERIIRIFGSGERSNGRECIGHLEINTIARKIIDAYEKYLKKLNKR